MEIEHKVRIVSSSPREAEALVNKYIEDYAPVVWNVQPGPDGPLVTCILISNRVLLAQQLTGARMVPGRPL